MFKSGHHRRQPGLSGGAVFSPIRQRVLDIEISCILNEGPLYHILPRRAHTILVQVCLGLLFHFGDRNFDKTVRVSPLVEYAARHWVAHAQFEDVASRMDDGTKSLFDLDKPHFAAWIGLCDIDTESGGRLPSKIPSPLYYLALWILWPSSARCHQTPAAYKRYRWLIRVGTGCGSMQKSFPGGRVPARAR